MWYKFQETPCQLETFSDTDWAGCRRTRRSATVGYTVAGSHLIKMWCKTQIVVALSSAEAELYGLVCEQNTLTRHIFSCLSALMIMSHTTLAHGVRARHTIHVSCACVFDLSSTLSSHSSYVSPIFYFILLIFHFIFYVGRFEVKLLCASVNEESGPLANNAPLTGYKPNFFDDYHFSETTEIFIQESSSGDTRPSYLHDSDISDDTIGRALSSPLFTQEREEPAGRRQAHHSLEESLLSSQSSSVCHLRTVRPGLSSCSREKPCRDSENEQIRIHLERQKRVHSR